jgi:hypothetical protein
VGIVAALAAKVAAPIIAALGSAVLGILFKLFIHGGLGAVDWLVKMGEELQVVQAQEADPSLSGPQKLQAAARVLLDAALAHGKVFATSEANFAVEILLQEFKLVTAAAMKSFEDNTGFGAAK